ncbi:MAG: transporter substrate-binding domain-containing protein, partial [Desulfobulbaceae bacterium]|nr:transporter substrate-binding domain-containing protein [Desulfobulbaceae bacterium]
MISTQNLPENASKTKGSVLTSNHIKIPGNQICVKVMLIITFLLCVTFAVAEAQQQSEGVNTLKIALLDFPPYEFQANNKIDGITVRIVREVFKRMNQPISMSKLPWSRALLYLQRGEIDGLFEILKKPEREEFADYSKVVLMDETASLFVLDDSSISFDGDLNKLQNYTVGVRQDFSYGAEFDQAVEDKVISKMVKKVYPEDLLRLLNFGRIDILIGDKYGIPYTYNKIYTVKNFKKIKRLSPDVQYTPSYMAFSKKRNLTKIRD